jgi:hypothetical protein
MIAATDFQEPQEGALSSRRHQQIGQTIPLTEETPQRVLQHKPRPAPPTLNANDEANLTQGAQQNSIILESKVRVCRVEALYPDEFTAIFSEPGLVDQRVRFARAGVALSDNDLLQEGAVFYWFTAKEKDPSGEIISKSHIRFRRRPRLSPEEAKELKKLADEAIIAGGGVPITDEDLE